MAAADVSIRKWKDFATSTASEYLNNVEPGFPDFWNGWRSPDIFVDNNGNRTATTTTAPHVLPTAGPFTYYLKVDEIGEPRKGKADNRLFAVIRNLGAAAAPGVTVRVSYSVYGVVGGTLYHHIHFKLIDQFQVDLDAKGFPDAEKETEVQWDLSDLTENNGGLWPAPISFWDHFCVRVELDFPGDSDPSNNWTQHNYGNVVSASPFSPIPLLVANSDPEPRTYELAAQQLPDKWELRIRGLEKSGETTITHGKAVKVALDPGEERFILLTIVPPQETARERAREKQPIGVALLSEGKPVGGFTLVAAPGARPRIGRRISELTPPLLTPHPEPVFFPRKETVLRFPNQLAVPGTFLARLSVEPLKK